MSEKLRCWPGCTARIDRAMLPENVGLVVQCLELFMEEGGPLWLVRGRPAPALCGNDGSVEICAEASVPDAWLTPLTPRSGADLGTEGTDEDLFAEEPSELVGVV